MIFSLNPFAISCLLIIVTYLPLLILILIKGRTKLAYIYALHIFTIFWWGIGGFLNTTNNDPEKAIAIGNFLYLAVLLIPVFSLHAVLILTQKSKSWLLYFAYIQAIIFITLTLMNKTFLTTKFMFDSIYIRQGGTIYLISYILWIIIVLITNFLLFQHYWISHANQRKQVLAFLPAFILGFIGGTFNFLPNFGINIYPLGNFFIPLYSLAATYAILRHQLLGIEIIIRRSIVYSVLIAFISVVYLLVVVVSEKFLQGFVGYKSIFISVITAFLLGIILVPLRNKIQFFIDRIFFHATQIELAQQNELLRQEVAKTEKFKAVATLASGMAHEIKNPLTAIKTFSEFLPQKLDDKEFLKKFAPLLTHEAERINQLVHNLLDFAKPAPLKLEDTDIHQLLTSTLNFMDNQFVKNRINVIYNFYDGKTPVLLKVDPNQLKQAFLNLFLNAIEAMSNGGTLTIRTKLIPNPSTLTPKNFQIIIKDTGGGINPEDIPHIFDPFFTKKDSGTGLGLSVTHGIIAQHGGRIWGESSLGAGAVFIVELPLLDKEQ